MEPPNNANFVAKSISHHLRLGLFQNIAQCCTTICDKTRKKQGQNFCLSFEINIQFVNHLPVNMVREINI